MKNQQLQIAMLVGEIQTLVYMVNTFTTYCAFVRFAGHVDRIEVDVSTSKEDYNDYQLRGSTYLKSKYEEPEKIIERLNTMKSNLRKILRTHSIDYSRLNYEIEEVRHYKLV